MKKDKTPYIKTKLPGPKGKRLISDDERYVSQSYTRVFPTVIDHAKGALIYDVDGNSFIDFHTGIGVCSTGNTHPEIVKAIKQQTEKAIHIATADFYHELVGKLAKKLAEITPGTKNKRTFFTNSGAESIECAIKLARYNKKRPRMIAFIGAFHGRTMGALSLTCSKLNQRRYFAPLLPEVTHIPYAYCYRCAYHLTYPRCDMACVKFLDEVILQKVAPAEEVSAIFVEPIQGEGGYIVPPREFHPMLKKIAEKYDILLVMDEIQSGMGRTGKMLAIEHWGVVPDIITLAKALASGMPLGACVAPKELMSWEPGAHSTTFGGNPISCASALATIKLLEGGLVKNAEKMGKFILKRLKVIRDKSRIIGDVRGIGLMIGIELVKSKKSREPAPEYANRLAQECFRNGLMILECGPNSVRFIPPLTIDEETADIGLKIFEKSLARVEKSRE